MKSIVNNIIKSEKPFPKLIKNSTTGTIVLATEHSSKPTHGGHGYKGCVISGSVEIGKYGDSWSPDFVDFEGSVTLSND